MNRPQRNLNLSFPISEISGLEKMLDAMEDKLKDQDERIKALEEENTTLRTEVQVLKDRQIKGISVGTHGTTVTREDGVLTPHYHDAVFRELMMDVMRHTNERLRQERDESTPVQPNEGEA